MYKRVLLLAMFSMLIAVNTLTALAPQKDRVIVKKSSGFQLGVIVKYLDQEALETKSLDHGVLILDVIEESEAEAIGLREDDVIIEWQGEEVESADQLAEWVEAIEETQDVRFKIRRGGEVLEKSARLEPGEEDKELEVVLDDLEGEISVHGLPRLQRSLRKLKEGPWSAMVSRKGGYLGVEARRLSDQLLTYFDVEYGVLLERVIEESPAEKSGLKAGDVITAIGKKEIHDYGDLVRTLNYHDPGEEVSVNYVRKGEQRNVTVELADKKAGFEIDSGKMHWNWRGGKMLQKTLDGDNKDIHIIKKNIRTPSVPAKPALRSNRVRMI